jgi:inner membrane protein
MTWWWWTVFGLVLLAVELVTPGGFFAFFFGLSALLVGGLQGMGVPLEPWLQWALFSLFAVGMLVAFRRPLQHLIEPPGIGDEVDRLTNEIATLLEDLPPGGIGKAELRGTSWTVKNDDRRALATGELAQVVRVDGLTLWVRAQLHAGGK